MSLQHQDHASSTDQRHGERPDGHRADDIDPFFVFDYVPLDGPDDRPPDGPRGPDSPDDGPTFTTYWDVEKGCRGPEPLPDWVITDSGALDTELGILKTGKEADVFLLERTAPDGTGVVMAAKRYRDLDHRSFRRSSDYTEGRTVRRSRDQRALARKSEWGRSVAAGQWAVAEWDALCRYWTAGLPVPYPVQLDGTEILMELIQYDDAPAPRLAQVRPGAGLLEEYFVQVRTAISVMAAEGVAHGDLSAYNILAAGERLVIIDLPQIVDLIANPNGPELLMRDCRNVCSWFQARGLDADPHELFEEVKPV
ncbi:serine protein kinase RIO [Ornithinimicrobium cryptoxanthini]|uniref:non-specific serine/threonine protein kinase n=1 Tax=Ornithinimicrobium cryptoxanthini TaxID=2934161 RepID=A0ABY4YLN5_9MICO|nr:RIO1 family regulatory kinase/ATPase [Ornithinimicrobium cryptoxanthini]USQ77649.1 serine/threonine protein kinase [Ornithinimicrobium cryptoxanthini]